MEDRIANKLEVAPAAGAAGGAIIWLLGTMLLWLLAFYDSSSSDSEWLRRAQQICFGRTESGLPDTYGWAILVLAPFSMFIGFFVSHSDELQAGLRGLRNSAIGTTLLCLLLGFAGIEALWVGRITYKRLAFTALASGESFPANALPPHLPESYPRQNKAAPPISLLNKDGTRTSLSEMRGKVGIVTFVFSHCQSVCPGIVQSLKGGLKAFPSEETFALLITLDPWRDTPSSLASFTEHWQLTNNMQVLSGSVEEVTRILDAYNVPRDKNAKTGDITHPALVSVISPTGELAYTFNNPTPQWLEDALRNVRTQ